MITARRVSLVCVVAGLLLAGGVPAAAAPSSHGGLGDEVAQLQSSLRIPGLAAQIVDSRGAIESAVAGHDGRDRPITTTTPFVWGSVSKSAAAAVISRLASSGRLSLRSPVRSVLPEARLPAAITVGDLIHHTSGLAHDLTVTDRWDRTGSALDVVRTWDPPASAERGRFRYSSVNYLVLQAVIEKTTARSFGDAVAATVDGGRLAGLIADADTFRRSVPPGYTPFFRTARRTTVGVDPAGFGYGYLAGSIATLGEYASWHLREFSSPAPDATLRREDLVSTGGAARYGYGWYVESMRDRSGVDHEVRWHSGAVPGYFTHVAFIPDLDRAIVLTANRYGELESAELAAAARSLAQTLIGRPLSVPSTAWTTYTAVLVTGGVLATALLGVLIAIGVRTRGRRARRSTRSVVLRCVAWTGLGAAATALVLVGVPSLAGAPLTVMSVWAPDAALLVWVICAEVVVCTVAAVAATAVVRRPQKGGGSASS